jgi:hypothetical protein
MVMVIDAPVMVRVCEPSFVDKRSYETYRAWQHFLLNF